MQATKHLVHLCEYDIYGDKRTMLQIKRKQQLDYETALEALGYLAKSRSKPVTGRVLFASQSKRRITR